MTQPFPFETERHRDETAPSAVHPTEFYSLTDPALDPDNDVAAGKRWRKTNDLATPTWFEVYIRNEANAAWILERAWVNDTFAVGEVPVADANGRLAPSTPTGGGTVSGTTDKLAKFTGVTAVGDSAVTENAGDLTSTKALILPASGTSIASLRAPHGAAPSSPVNGDVWTTTSGIYARINGVTVGPLLDSGAGGVTGSGTTGTIPKWSSGSAIGDSDLVEGAADITITKALYLGAGTTSVPSLRAPHGAAPSSPTNGDIWTTTAGIYVRINGVTVGPLAAAGSGVALVRATFVQAKQSISEYANITLDATPSDGNWLVWLACSWSSPTPNVGGAIAADTHRWQELVNVGGNTFDGVRAWYRRVRSADSATVTPPYPTGTAGQNAVCFEVAGGGGAPVVFDWLLVNGDPQILSGFVLNDTSFMVGMFANTSNSADDPTITGSVATVTEGTRATGTSANGSPRQINPFYCNCEKGAQTITADYAAAQNTIAVAVVFPPALDA